MLFNSLEFAIFLPIVLALYAAVPMRWRWVLLLVASYVFYMAWEPAYGLLLLASTTVDWWVSNRLPTAGTDAARKRLLATSLAANLGLLFTFKYYNMVNATLSGWASDAGVAWPLPDSELLLPVGISFYTFQTIGYTIDVYRGKVEPERNFGRLALYVAFFPQLVAGPIERADRLLPQLRDRLQATWPRLVSGLRLAAWGLFKKVVVADRLAILVDAVYSDPTQFKGFALFFATLIFAWQVYCDFSGYSDVAIGVARCLGIDLMQNFDQPHLSRSMTEIWTRWHISLSTWFRDYIYIPLGGNRVGPVRWSLNILVVFVVSGLWHGAEWRFALWGAMHGLLLVIDRYSRPFRDRVARASGIEAAGLRPLVQVACTFAIWLVTLVPFRASSMEHTLWVYQHVWSGWTNLGDPDALALFLTRVNLDWVTFGWILLLGPLVEVVDYGLRTPSIRDRVTAWPEPARWVLDYALVFGILFMGVWSDTPFVYFQF